MNTLSVRLIISNITSLISAPLPISIEDLVDADYDVELLQEIAECTSLYLTNRCDPSMRVPAMEAACRAWELCMNRDPTSLGRISIVAETFANVLNSFTEQISWRTMVCLYVVLIKDVSDAR